MINKPRTIIVVPCYNEAGRLDPMAFAQFARSTESIEFLLVNDGSRDNTLDVLKQMHKSHPRQINYLDLPQNGGKAEAVRQGMIKAIDDGATLVGFWDADLATSLEEIPRFVDVLVRRPTVELVIGSRIRLLGHTIERRWLRGHLGRYFAQVASLALGLRVYDTQCGAKLFYVGPDLKTSLAEPFLTNWIFDVELLARLKVAPRRIGRAPFAMTVYEYPLESWREVAGSKVRPGDFFKAFGDLARVYWTYLRPGAPRGKPIIANVPADNVVAPALVRYDSAQDHATPAASRAAVRTPQA